MLHHYDCKTIKNILIVKKLLLYIYAAAEIKNALNFDHKEDCG
jgi:hypothetical protein